MRSLQLVGCAVIAGLALGTVTGCNAIPAAPALVAAQATKAMVPPETVKALGDICANGAGVLAIASSPLMPEKVQLGAVFFSTYCRQLAALAGTGQVPPTTDAGTMNWLIKGLSDLSALTRR